VAAGSKIGGSDFKAARRAKREGGARRDRLTSESSSRLVGFMGGWVLGRDGGGGVAVGFFWMHRGFVMQAGLVHAKAVIVMFFHALAP
jgi:hypothetical protein